MAMAKSPTGRLVTSFQSIGGRSARRVDLKGLDVGEKLRTVSLLLADGRQGLDGGELHVLARRLILSDRDVMAPRPRRSRELRQDPMSSIRLLRASGRGGQPIGLYSHQKARAEILRQAKELVDVAL